MAGAASRLRAEGLPDLGRTSAAIAAYDIVDAGVAEVFDELTPELAVEALALLDEAGEAVGRAFGEDTRDRNSPETCAGVVRPGPAVPPPGGKLSFVRRMVNQWRERA